MIGRLLVHTWVETTARVSDSINADILRDYRGGGT